MARARPSASSWKCPKCGRTFRHRTREHSCIVTSIESHLERTSIEVSEAFRAVVDVLDSLGPVPVRVVPLKTMIVFSTAATFGGATFTRARFDLGFFLEVPLRHRRIRRAERISPRKFANHLHISTAREVDAEVEQWLTEAYQRSLTSDGN
jgi:uncharacterized protein DUF5655